jgi:VWFA-related protein
MMERETACPLETQESRTGPVLKYIPLLALCGSAVLMAQENRPVDSVQREQVTTLKSTVNLVLVPVVVRDDQGRTIGRLTKDQFELFDKGKQQTISSFSSVHDAAEVHRTGPDTSVPAKPPEPDSPSGGTVQQIEASPGRAAVRSFVYLFDDIHINFATLANLRKAAERHFEKNLGPGDRAAIYTFSGKPNVEFTADEDKLRDAVSKLRWRAGHGQGMQCPNITYYIADLVIANNDPQALAALTAHTAECAHVPVRVARELAWAAANRKMVFGAEDTQIALGTVRRAIQYLSAMPGQRIIILASPGFFAQTPEAIRAAAGVLNLAAKSNVVIQALSVRGVIVADEEADVAARGSSPRRSQPGIALPQMWIEYQRESARADGG